MIAKPRNDYEAHYRDGMPQLTLADAVEASKRTIDYQTQRRISLEVYRIAAIIRENRGPWNVPRQWTAAEPYTIPEVCVRDIEAAIEEKSI